MISWARDRFAFAWGVLRRPSITRMKNPFGFFGGYAHNVRVMFNANSPMKQWLDSRAAGFDKATVGQLLTLLKLANAESVAAAARDEQRASYESAGTNARQKLGRLE